MSYVGMYASTLSTSTREYVEPYWSVRPSL